MEADTGQSAGQSLVQRGSFWQRGSGSLNRPCLSSRIFSFLDVVTLCRCAQVSRVSLCSQRVDECVQDCACLWVLCRMSEKNLAPKCLFLPPCPQSWNVLALDGSNWQRIDLFDFQRDIEVNK